MKARELIAKEVRYTRLCCEQHFKIVPAVSESEVIADFAKWADATRPIGATETGVITLLKPKTAALLADRVWLQFAGEEPNLDFAFGWQSPVAIRLGSLLAFMRSGEVNRPNVKANECESSELLTKYACAFLDMAERELCEDYARVTGASVTPLYSSGADRDKNHTPGSLAAITSVIEHVALVDEGSLTWEQVIEFRRDENARRAYFRFVHWLDSEFVGKPSAFVTDEVEARLDKYYWALKKHGLKTLIGVLERTLDARSILGSAASALTIELIAREPLMSLLGGIGLLVGNASIRLATCLMDRQDIVLENREIAYVHELKRAAGG